MSLWFFGVVRSQITVGRVVSGETWIIAESRKSLTQNVAQISQIPCDGCDRTKVEFWVVHSVHYACNRIYIVHFNVHLLHNRRARRTRPICTTTRHLSDLRIFSPFVYDQSCIYVRREWLCWVFLGDVVC